ncbi:MAG: BolA family transcriptional regulator [Hyphomicrobiaceae bacterium]|nr:MAG: BolA family transcriptional regulator [Hyphomicrobiaceae bacterium]
MNAESIIRDTLTSSFQPVALEIINESHLHHGHASSPGTGESHFRLKVVSEAFRGKSRVERHRMVNEALAGLLKTRVHALALTARTPDEN